MTDEVQANVTTEEALDRVQESWDRLMVTMSSAPVSEYATRRDANGWTALDHMAHVTAWERSRRNWLLGRPRSEGLGVTPEQFGMEIDALNDIVRAQTADQTYQQIMDAATAGHQQLVDAVMSVGTTARVDSDGITQDEVDRIGVLLIEHLADHYDEHRVYIDRMLTPIGDRSGSRSSGAQRKTAITMAERDPIRDDAKQALMGAMQAWTRLMGTMAKAPKAEYTRKHDPAGWTALDHFAHVSAWERSRLTWLQGRPRFEGLGVTPERFKLDYDQLNEIVREQTKGQSYDEVMDAALPVHQAMMDAIRTFDPDDVPRSGGITTEEIADIGAQITENLTDHYDEHRRYIQKILAG